MIKCLLQLSKLFSPFQSRRTAELVPEAVGLLRLPGRQRHDLQLPGRTRALRHHPPVSENLMRFAYKSEHDLT